MRVIELEGEYRYEYPFLVRGVSGRMEFVFKGFNPPAFIGDMMEEIWNTEYVNVIDMENKIKNIVVKYVSDDISEFSVSFVYGNRTDVFRWVVDFDDMGDEEED